MEKIPIHPSQLDRQVTLILGMTGFGKTQFAKHLVEDCERLLIYDKLGTYWNAKYKNPEDVQDFIFSHDDDKLANLKFRFAWHKEEAVPIFGITAFQAGNTTLLLEEMSTITNKGVRDLPKWFKEMIFLGRHQRMNIIMIAQRPASVPIDLRSQANRVICFQQVEDCDLTWLKSRFGKMADDIPNLEKFECIDRYDGKLSRYKIHPWDGVNKPKNTEEESIYTMAGIDDFIKKA